MERALAEAGIASVVRVNETCTSDDRTHYPLGELWTFADMHMEGLDRILALDQNDPARRDYFQEVNPIITFYVSRIPKDRTVGLSLLTDKNGAVLAISGVLMATVAPSTCRPWNGAR